MIRFLFAVIGLLFFSTAAHSQAGVVIGYVKDKNTQEALIGAAVTVEGTTRGAISDEDGNYKIDSLPVGTYNLTINFLGFKPQSKFNVVVTSGNAQTVNFELEEGGRELEEVVISLNKNKTAAAADMVTPMSTQRLTTEEIKANPGGNFDVSRVIQVLPGVGGGTSVNRNDIIVRGGAPNENVYYLDGVEIPVLNHFQTQGASGGATGILNVSFIDDVQLSSSAFDARYDNALASTFNIKQRTGNPEDFGGNIRLSGTELAATLEGPVAGSKNTTFLASARRSYLQLLFQALDVPIRPDYWDFQYKVAHRIDQKTTPTFIGVGAIDRFRLGVPREADDETEYILRSNPWIDQWNYTFGIALKRLIKDGYVNVVASRNMFDNSADRFENNIPDEQYRTLKLRSQEIENKLRIDVNKFVKGWKFSYGLMGQYVKYNASIFNQVAVEVRDANNNLVSPSVNVQFNSAIDFFKYGAFGQVSRRFFNEKLLLSAGVRTDMNSFTTTGNDPLSTLSPRFSFLYRLSNTLDLTGSIGSYYKLPVYTNLGYRDSTGTLVNRDMKYIQSNHYAMGLQLLPRADLRMTLEGFYKQYNNYPVSARTGISLANQGTEFTSVGNEAVLSTGTGQTYGVEFFIQQKLIKKLFYALSATVYKSEFAGADAVLRPSSWDYGYLFATTVGYKFGKGWELGLKYRVSGGQPYTPFDLVASRYNYIATGTGTLNYAAINSLRLSPFHQLDLRIDKKINFRKTSLDLYFDMQNVYRAPSPDVPNYTFKRNEDNSGFATTDGQPLKPDGSNAVPVILENNDPVFLPTIGFIFEF